MSCSCRSPRRRGRRVPKRPERRWGGPRRSSSLKSTGTVWGGSRFPSPAGGIGRLRLALETFNTVVCYKGGYHLPEIIDLLAECGRLDGTVYGASLGLDGEQVCPAREMQARRGPYLSTLIVPPKRTARGSEL